MEKLTDLQQKLLALPEQSKLEIRSRANAPVLQLVVAIACVPLLYLALEGFSFTDTMARLVPSPTTRAQSTQARTPNVPSWFGIQHKLQVGDSAWSEAIRVTGDRCFRFWGDDPDGNAFTIQARGINDSTWMDWNDFMSRKARGTITYNPGWIRAKSTAGIATVNYEFRLPGQCD